MPNPLITTHPSSSPPPPPPPPKLNGHLPFSKPLGFFPPNGEILIPMPNSATQTLDLLEIETPFPTSATLQELELGTVIAIDEDLFEGPIFGPVLVRKAQGMYVARSKYGHSHIMAMTTSFAIGEFKDGLMLFGMHRRGDAIVKAINESSQYVGGEIGGDNKFLMFNVYLG